MNADGSASAAHLDWPSLPPLYDAALRLAVDAALAEVDPVGIVAGGSVLRGQGGPTSDIDLYVIHLAPYRRRLQRRYGGVPFEIFINPPDQVRRYFVEEAQRRRPITAHLLATGFVVLDRGGVAEQLRREAAAVLAEPPAVDASAQTLRRYLTVDLLDNARDLLESDPAMADLMLWRVLGEIVEWRLVQAVGWLPRIKETLAVFRQVDDVGAGLVEQAHNAKTVAERLAAVAALAQHTLGVDTYFEWDGEWGPAPSTDGGN